MLPRPEEKEERSLIPGVSNWAPSTHRNVDPNGYKALLGYYGPYYNVEDLDGRVRVLDNTVYVWPGESWRATGLVRNQSCETVRITSLTARLIGLHGESLDVATAILPVEELRSGEPVPFMIEASIVNARVVAVDWNVEYASSETISRNLKFQIYEADQVRNGSIYLLLGSVYNLGSTTATSTYVVAAWLDREDKLRYVIFPKMQLNPKESRSAIDLEAGGVGDFLYTTDDASFVSLLAGARIMLWGVSK